MFAIKSISKKNLTEADLITIKKEVQILSTLNHPNIIKFYETYHDNYFFHMVMELCSGKELFDKIADQGAISERKVAKIIFKILGAIAYCHEMGISHRDLKPENILFENTSEDAEVKLIDFGLSTKYNRKEKMHSVLGTPFYVAPEVLKGEYDEKCDIWSIGALAYMMLSGVPPFYGENNNEIFEKIINEKVTFPKLQFADISSSAINFISTCLKKNPSKRISAKQALVSEWFKDIDSLQHSNENLQANLLKNLINFDSPHKLMQLTYHYILDRYSSEEEVKILKDSFNALNYENNGFITLENLQVALEEVSINISDQELKNVLKRCDFLGLGKINYTEFMVAAFNKKDHLKKDELISAFNYFDMDKSGFIDSKDMTKAMQRFGKEFIRPEEVDTIVNEIDSQGKISFEGFYDLFIDKTDNKLDKSNNSDKEEVI